MAGGRVNRARLDASLATGTVVERQRELLQKRPVVFGREQPVQPGDEAFDELLFFFFSLWPGHADGEEAVERTVAVRTSLIAETLARW